MKTFRDPITWISRNFFFLTLSIFVIIYFRWFRLTPFVFDRYNDPNEAYVAGLILLGLYTIAGLLFRLPDSLAFIRVMFYFPAVLLFFLNSVFIYWFSPKLITTAKCNKVAYYITNSSPLSDPQWSYYQFTKWEGYFQYRSVFFGYSGGGYKIVCDEEKKEANIIRTLNNVLAYSEGENPRRYVSYTGTQLKSLLYFLAEKCNDWVPSTCGSMTYTLYQCNLNYKSCDPLPIQFTTDDSDAPRVLEANEFTNEINLFDGFEDNPDRKLIFTYGEHPRCYMEGCEILSSQSQP